MPALIGADGVYVSGVCSGLSCPAEIPFWWTPVPCFSTLLGFLSNTSDAVRGHKSGNRSTSTSVTGSSLVKNIGLAPTCAAGSGLGDSDMPWIKTEACWLILWCWSFFACFRGFFFFHRTWLIIQRSRQSSPHTEWQLAGQSKSEHLLSSTWPLHHV